MTAQQQEQADLARMAAFKRWQAAVLKAQRGAVRHAADRQRKKDAWRELTELRTAERKRRALSRTRKRVARTGSAETPARLLRIMERNAAGQYTGKVKLQPRTLET